MQTINPDRSRISVLVVEDEPLLLLDATDILEDAGFVVHAASNADEARRILARRPDIDVLFTDVDMPGSMDGLQLAGTATAERPSLRVVIASGRRGVERERMPAGGVFLAKPYRPVAAVDAVRGVRPRLAVAA